MQSMFKPIYVRILGHIKIHMHLFRKRFVETRDL